jgi:hypothetical protein
MAAPLSGVVPPVVRRLQPLAGPYLELTATRQNWRLFAPWPADWKGSLEVVPYFPVPGSDDQPGWQADTLRIRGPMEVPYPHLLHHRTYRILFNMAYVGWGEAYRPHFAREMCRTLRTRDGRAPDGVSLVAEWRYIRPPWSAESVPSYRQRMGGFDCPDQTGRRQRASWPPYGLPRTVDVSGWPVVSARDSVEVEP